MFKFPGKQVVGFFFFIIEMQTCIHIDVNINTYTYVKYLIHYAKLTSY